MPEGISPRAAVARPASLSAGSRQPLLRLVARERATPMGALLGGLGALAAAAVGLLRLDQLGLTLCTLKAVTGIPCPTCGATRVLARLAHLDFAAALAMNPLVTAGVVAVVPWALADLVLLNRGRALALETSRRGATLLGLAAAAALLSNWVYLLAAGR